MLFGYLDKGALMRTAGSVTFSLISPVKQKITHC